MSDRAVRVERAGLQTLIVDHGRFGLRHEGVGWCGAMDCRSFEAANVLAGNTVGHAAIEIVLGDFAVTFETAARFALTGADCHAELDGQDVRAWRTQEARAGSCLTLRRPSAWMRSYLAIDGGVDVPVVLGSRTTDLLATMGGFEGRALRAGDRIALGVRAGAPEYTAIEPPRADFVLRTIAQPLGDRLWNRAWTVGHQSNRMGYRLSGAAEPHDVGAMPSHAVFPGFIQLPPQGEPIVLMRDAQTTGGYPLGGVVVEDDMWMLAQAPIGAVVRFVEVRV
jgi:5-oxoprolinase (ATP-hydrolysing) subunit C